MTVTLTNRKSGEGAKLRLVVTHAICGHCSIHIHSENMSKITLIFSGCLPLMSISIMATGNMKSDTFIIFNGDLNVYYHSSNVLNMRKPLDCLYQCTVNMRCAAAMILKNWKEYVPNCRLYMFDASSDLDVKTIKEKTYKDIWLIERNIRPQFPSCSDPFTQTAEGCFLVGVHNMSWDNSELYCQQVRSDAHLAELYTQEVCFTCFSVSIFTQVQSIVPQAFGCQHQYEIKIHSLVPHSVIAEAGDCVNLDAVEKCGLCMDWSP